MSVNQFDLPTVFEKMPINKDFPILLQDIYTQDDAPILKLHCHSAIEIGFCISGSGLFNVENSYVPYSAGDVVIISRDTLHYAQSSPGTFSTWQYAFFDIDSFMAKFIPASLKSDLTTIFHNRFGASFCKDNFPEINALVRKILDEMKYKRKFYELGTISLLIELCVILSREGERAIPRFFKGKSHSASSIHQLTPAISTLQSNYNRQLRLEDLSESCCMSVRSFLRHFKDVYNTTPYEYLTELRLIMICKDLKSTDRSINYIADSNGFNSISSFNRQFKQHFKMSPSKWRIQNQSNLLKKST